LLRTELLFDRGCWIFPCCGRSTFHHQL
jgi:hypothetical protein